MKGRVVKERGKLKDVKGGVVKQGVIKGWRIKTVEK
jgi:hypothetical protein